jgi:hypothetical protein
MTEPCEFCGEGATDERGEPMYYEEEDIHAHMDCAIDEGVGME